MLNMTAATKNTQATMPIPFNTVQITEKEFKAFDSNDTLNRVLEGVIFFASVHYPDTTGVKLFQSDPVYKITLGLDSDEEIQKALSYGHIIKEPNEYINLPHVVIKTAVRPRDQRPQEFEMSQAELFEAYKPELVDRAQSPIPSDVLIANGSRGKVKYNTYWYNTAHKNGVGTRISKIQVTDLIRYIPDESKRVDSDFEVGEPVDYSKVKTVKAESDEKELDAIEELIEDTVFDDD